MGIAEIEILRIVDELAASLAACEHLTIEECSAFRHTLRVTAGVQDVAEPTALLRELPRNHALSGTRLALLRVQRHLLAMVIAEDHIDAERACVVLQHLYGEQHTEWAEPVLKFAAALGIDLSRSPRECTAGSILKDAHMSEERR